MNHEARSKLFETQLRAYTEGTIEQINDQWIFFDGETEEAARMDDFLQQEIEVFRLNRWKKGILIEAGVMKIGKDQLLLRDQDPIRVRKQLIYSLERLLDSINEDAFFPICNNLKFLEFFNLRLPLLLQSFIFFK